MNRESFDYDQRSSSVPLYPQTPKFQQPPPSYQPSTKYYGYQQAVDQDAPYQRPPAPPRKKLFMIVGLITAAVIIAIVIGVPVGVTRKKNSYPNYSRINYKLQDSMAGESFFDSFTFFTGKDPTHGFVQYLDPGAAAGLNLTHATADSVIVRADSSNAYAVQGRQSVRLHSRNTYDTGLFVFTVRHAPTGCGTWPALWLTDPDNWPANGEVDIFESTNQATTGNSMTLHTTSGCDMNVKRKETGSPELSTCDVSKGNVGCGVKGEPNSAGKQFNDNGGGVSSFSLVML